MRKVCVDLRNIEYMEDVHTALAAALHFPDYYGKNLDALHDCLTDISEDTCVGIYAPGDAERAEVVRRVQQVFEDAEEENLHLCAFFFFPEERPVALSGNPFDPNFVPDPDDAELMGWYGMRRSDASEEE